MAAISGRDVDVAPFDGTTRKRFAAVLGSRVRPLAVEDAPAGITTGDACKPTPLSLSLR